MTRSETIVASPFAVPANVRKAISDVRIESTAFGTPYSAAPLPRRSTIFIPSDQKIEDFKLLVDLSPEVLREGLAEIGHNTDSVQVISLLRLDKLKRVEILSSWTGADLEKGELVHVGTDEQAALASLSSQVPIEISTYLVLDTETVGIRFAPPRGAALSSYGFRLQPTRKAWSFSPQVLEQEVADRFKVPMETMVYVHFSDKHANPLLDGFQVDESMEIYVNSEVWNNLQTLTRLDKRQALTSLVLSNAVSQILFQLHVELKEGSVTWEELGAGESVARTIVNTLAGKTNPEAFVGLVKNNMSRALAIADANLGTVQALEGFDLA